MIEHITIEGDVTGFTEDKDRARSVRQNLVLPALERGDSVVLDFAGVATATQSFIHALVGEPLKKYGEQVLSRLEFKNCSPQVRTMVEIVVDYSLGGFDFPLSPAGPPSPAVSPKSDEAPEARATVAAEEKHRKEGNRRR